jgi:rhamnosyltransferase
MCLTGLAMTDVMPLTLLELQQTWTGSRVIVLRLGFKQLSAGILKMLHYVSESSLNLFTGFSGWAPFRACRHNPEGFVVSVDSVAQSQPHPGESHAVVIPLYGDCPVYLPQQVQALAQSGFVVLLVLNNPTASPPLPQLLQVIVDQEPHVICILNENQGGVAGGFNRGVQLAVALGVQWITLLDQDSVLQAHELSLLTEPWRDLPGMRIIVGPMIWDEERHKMHGRTRYRHWQGYFQTRLLISSGTTFRAVDWYELGPMMESLFIDYVDHFWCFNAQARGFVLLHHPRVRLVQVFGRRHPNPVCRYIGMQLYSPMRHYYSLRNLRLLLLNRQVPFDLRLKEFIKMLVKPWLWLLFEPRRSENLKAILDALLTPLPTKVS